MREGEREKERMRELKEKEVGRRGGKGWRRRRRE